MFRLLRYFAVSSAIIVIAVAILLLGLYRQSAVKDLIELAEHQNIALARSFANTIWPRFSSYVRSTSGLRGDTLRARPETREIHEALKGLADGLPVLKIKVYNPYGLTVYSSQADEIGVFKLNNPGLITATEEGRTASKLTFRDAVSSFEGTVQSRDLVESYLPIRLGDGPVEGVFELYSDVTPLIAQIDRTTIEIVIAFVVVSGLLYGGLVLIVGRADHIVRQQYGRLESEIAERVQAERGLKEAHEQLEQRVRERTRDLTQEVAERRQAEKNLRKLTRAVEQSPAMTVITDLGGKIEYVNPRFTEVTGYTLDEVFGKTPRILKSGEMRPEAYVELWRTITAGKEWRGEIRNRRKDGRFYWALTSISPITDEHGKITHFLGSSEDISERKRAEDEARQRRSELAHAGRVIVMGEMATSLAHELNQPLTVISSCAQVWVERLRSGRIDCGDLLDSAEQVAEQTERAKNFIHRIRGFMQKEDSERKTINLNDTIANIADLLRFDAREHGAVIKLNLADTLPPIIADPLQIQQVILNLAHNGLEAMGETSRHSRTLTIRTTAGRNDMVEVVVHDTGKGLSAENLKRVFEPFFTTKPTGLGMGLSISRTIIEAHGGRLWAKSNSGTGTEFCFTLPISEETFRHAG